MQGECAAHERKRRFESSLSCYGECFLLAGNDEALCRLCVNKINFDIYSFEEYFINSIITRFTEGSFMKGIQYMVNEKGEKQAVILSLKEYGSIWEDM